MDASRLAAAIWSRSRKLPFSEIFKCSAREVSSTASSVTARRTPFFAYIVEMLGPSSARTASTRGSVAFVCRPRSETTSKMRTRSRTGIPSSSRADRIRCTSPMVIPAAASSSVTVGSVCFTDSTSALTSLRESSFPALLRTTSERCVTISELRSTTVAPIDSACALNSDGTQRAGRLKTGSTTSSPGSPV